MKIVDIIWKIIEITIINGPVPLMSVASSSKKYEKLTENASTVKISKTFVIGG